MSEILDGLSMDLEKTNMEKLKVVFPECFSEGRLDIDKLLSLCGEYIDNDFEKYKFEWKGKSECLRLAQKRSTGTLRPCREESVNFDDTQNIYIEGDNLEVLKLLQTAYYNKIKMIYIDPPYNTGNDFVYEDDFADPMARYKEITQQTTKSNPETMGRFHTNWLNMMYPRLRLAANLLIDDGAICISIDDNEVSNLRKICDEVLGEENFVAQIIWHSRQNKDNRNISGASIDHEYILCYSKKFGNRIFSGTERKVDQYTNPDNDPRGPWTSANMVGLATADARPNLHYDLVDPHTGINYGCPHKGWRYDKKSMSRLIEEDRIIWPENPDGRPRKKAFLNELSGNLPGFSSIIAEGVYTNTATKEVTSIFSGEHLFDFPKPTQLIGQLLSQITSKDDIVLDFFSGSATTAHAVMQLNAEDGGNRRFICVQLPELCDEKSGAYKAGYYNICEIGKERIRRAGKKLLEENTQIKLGDDEKKPLDVGFKVFKLDTSNLKTWDNAPIKDTQIDLFYKRMNDMIDSIKDDRTDMDVVYEVMLKMGVPLDVPVQYIEVNDKIVYIVGDFLLMIALFNDITAEDIEAIAAYAPAKIICAESGFADDSALSNAYYILKDKNIELKLV